MHALRGAILILSLLLAAGAAPAQTGVANRFAAAGQSAAPAGLIDVNRASAAELKTLPGIRDAYASAIVKSRPYRNKAQILSRKVIPRAAYLKIRDLIIAKQ